MTAVMRAAHLPASHVPLVLRVGTVRGGRIVEERVLKQRASFEVFERKGDGYVVRLDAGTTGRLLLTGEVVTVETLRERGMREIALPEDARGKIVVGNTTFLFQFVQPPPPQAKPQLPLAVKGGFANQIDWSLTIISALSFLLHFGIVGAMYSDWMDEVVDEKHTVAGIVEMMNKIPTPPVTEMPTTSDTPTEAETPSPTKTTATTSVGRPSKQTSARKNAGDSEAARLAAQAESIEVALLAAKNGGSAVEGTLNRTAIPAVDLSEKAASRDGATASNSDLHVHGGAPITGHKDSGLTAFGGDTHATANSNAGDTRTIAAPKVDSQIGPLGGTGAVNGADHVIAGLRGRFRVCYQRGLQSDPTMSGKVTITAKIAPNGEVTNADVASSSGVSNEVAQCMVGVIKHAQFDAQPNATTLNVPVSVLRQQ
jgi:outer membrane biosynthesis protein TonB